MGLTPRLSSNERHVMTKETRFRAGMTAALEGVGKDDITRHWGYCEG